MKPVTAITVSIMALAVTLALDRAGVLRQPAGPIAVTPAPAPGAAGVLGLAALMAGRRRRS